MTTDLEYLLGRLVRYTSTCPDREVVRNMLGMRRLTFQVLLEEARDRGLLIPPQGQKRVDRPRFLQDSRSSLGLTLDEDVIEAAEKYCQLRPQPDKLIDQCPVTSRSLAARAMLMHKNGDVDGRSILCVGDNDLLSLLIATIGEPKEICVVDVDERVLKTIEEVSRAHGFPISTIRFDIRALSVGDYPKDIVGKFDVFQTDPPYTEVGMKYFIAFGVLGLKRKATCYITVPHMTWEEWTSELLFQVERFLLHNNFVITEVIPGFQIFLDKEGLISSIIRAERPDLLGDPFGVLQILAGLNPGKFYTVRGVPSATLSRNGVFARSRDPEIQRSLEAVRLANEKGCLARGILETIRAIEKGKAKVVVIADDVNPPCIVDHILRLCGEKGIPLERTPSKTELGRSAGLEVAAAAVAITREIGYRSFEKVASGTMN